MRQTEIIFLNDPWKSFVNKRNLRIRSLACMVTFQGILSLPFKMKAQKVTLRYPCGSCKLGIKAGRPRSTLALEKTMNTVKNLISDKY